MQRRRIDPRPDWRARVEAQGLVFHTTAEHGVYWGEDSYYELTEREADDRDRDDRAHLRCPRRVAHVERRLRRARHQPSIAPLVERSWRERAPSLYGRMDRRSATVPRLLSTTPTRRPACSRPA
jgi:glutathionylspermidine synthase